ncbi:hypothetical protein HMPREF3213_03110 [Heyndrickxia coagulans]|uniref:Uncharacterized protein n=1 Tax=Heyndrickxia coagulans TaxID=1398 RepID=A0A133KFB5_HEYCO|nr:hypothetical protein HMPREF3213_03110 [Heyndrickxia coagulans]
MPGSGEQSVFLKQSLYPFRLTGGGKTKRLLKQAFFLFDAVGLGFFFLQAKCNLYFLHSGIRKRRNNLTAPCLY